jgi:hypothetical protein
MTSELCGCINTIDVLLLIGDPVGGRGGNGNLPKMKMVKI